MSSAGDLRSGKTHRDENFPVASWIIHPRHRGLILAFYNFVRTADDIADHSQLPAGEKLLYLRYDQIYFMLTFGGARHYTPIELVPEIGRIKERLLQAGAKAACMSGSGSAVFGIFADSEAATAALPAFADLPFAQVCQSI